MPANSSLKLERSLGRPAHFWNNLERQFQEDRTRFAEEKRLRSHLHWLKKVPVNNLRKFGWISKTTDKISQLKEVLQFFGAASPEQWETVWQKHQLVYRQTKRFESCAESVSAWLRKGEIEARQIQCASFNIRRFQEVLDIIRGLTVEPPHVFQQRLIELCASAGVAVVFVPELPKTGVYGATRWLGGKAVIQLSLRYKSNDHLWFTFFMKPAISSSMGARKYSLKVTALTIKKRKKPNFSALVIGIISLDLTIYLQHVMFHAVPQLWRLYMVHHADLDYDLTTGLRFHPIEIVLSMMVKLIVIAALGQPAAAVLVFEIL